MATGSSHINIRVRTTNIRDDTLGTSPMRAGPGTSLLSVHRLVSPYALQAASSSYSSSISASTSLRSAASSLTPLASLRRVYASNNHGDSGRSGSRAPSDVSVSVSVSNAGQSAQSADEVRAESLALSLALDADHLDLMVASTVDSQRLNSATLSKPVVNTTGQRGRTTERTPLLADSDVPVDSPGPAPPSNNLLFTSLNSQEKDYDETLSLATLPFHILSCLPAATLGLLLILLDSLSYGVIVFPSKSSIIPVSAPQVGVQMFLVSTILSQLVFTFLSKFPGANGSMQIEVMPFLYLIVASIESDMAESGASVEAVLATVMVAVSLSTILTGVVFFLLAYYKLGNLIQFFPRQVLIGCIGGIGWFLMVTGVEITSGLTPEFSVVFWETLFTPSVLLLWGSSLGLAILLKVLQHRIHNPLFVPAFYCIVPVLFYIIAFSCGATFESLRDMGFLFNMSGDPLPFYTLWTYFNGFQGISWLAVLRTLPIQASLVFFALLHVPINIPALGVSTGQQYDMNNELYCHGVSNTLAGVFGVPQNYLVYSNSLLVMRCGGQSRVAGALLAIGTAALWLVGGDVIRFVPTLLIGCLIFHLGIDLLLESLIDTLHMPISRLEYITVLSIVFVMGVFGFTEGILLGVCLALLFFVVEYSKESVILETFDGSVSNVRRSMEFQEYLEGVKGRVHGVRVYGFVFFGVISQIERHLEGVLQSGLDGGQRVHYVILDCSLVKGVDFSALQGFQRLKEFTASQGVQLIFCSMGKLGDTISKSGIFDKPFDVEAGSVELPVLQFESTQTALEYCENEILYQSSRDSYLHKRKSHHTHQTAQQQTLLESWLISSNPTSRIRFLEQRAMCF
ncbi:hypothetical protein BCR33DRAFT_699149 [Rhizoclosmatium globosum]|uniref:STAS domain-containing protein n=1 Tax=Rhizoclosmatium globosum TaxID=329046 RepID=A0A1Y2C3M0_9FUNG|nr:hypothetical protein BCR33DRAFT_699149 [Rhizoclosmatium globosum]|eukprot:ORY40905.1 hypothetical protein BCR33DRAFT_699149 [Rhizoclosmatium globosum]